MSSTWSQVAFVSSHTMSLRWVMIDPTLRSLRLNTRSTMSCSTSSISPSAAPFLNDRLDLFLGYPVSVDRIDTQYAKHAAVLFDSSQTNGSAIFDSRAHRPRHDLGYAFRGAHADSLGNQLAQNQRQISDRDYDDYLSDRHRMRLERWNSRDATFPKLWASMSPE